MRTYEELLEVGSSDKEIGEFCEKAIREYESTENYVTACVASQYYKKHNVTIETFEKWIYTVTGRKVRDIYSANHKLQTHAFRRMVIQQANYLLGKGIQMDDQEKKDRLGKNFDHQLLKACKIAMVEGCSYGYWNADHLEVFGTCCTNDHAGFCPIYSEETGLLNAGVSFRKKYVKNKYILYMTLYDPDGVTKFVKRGSDGVETREQKRAYKIRTVVTKAEGIVDMMCEGYNGVLPIVPMYASDTYESELVGYRESIDCYDLMKSGLANNLDDASEIYWIVQNAGGMDDPDLARFLQRLKRTKVADIDSQSGGGAEAHTLEVPTEARKTILEILRTDLYDDMMLLDRRTMSAAQKTNQELEMAYQPQDDRTNDLEFFVIDFCEQVMALAGIESGIRFERSKVVNTNEQVSMVLSSANYISPECVIRHLSFLSPEEMEEEIEKMEKDSMKRFGLLEDEEDNPDEQGEQGEPEEEEE